MLKTNVDQLLEIAVVGEPSHPRLAGTYNITPRGEAIMVPGTGGICFNVRVGDRALGWAADHVEPAVSLKNPDADANNGLNMLACVGNEAEVLDGPAAGEKGVVTGKHGGIEHVFVDFPPEVLRKLRYGNKIQINSCGLGLKLLDFPEITVANLAPSLLKKMSPTEHEGKLRVKVAKLVPACIMGSGLGRNHAFRGDYDIQMFDDSVVEEYGLADLRLGDLVALVDADNSYGRIYLRGAVTVGVVVHGQCLTAGHGPGVTCLLSSATGAIEPIVDKKANLATLLKLR
jgi:hypothetical protein